MYSLSISNSVDLKIRSLQVKTNDKFVYSDDRNKGYLNIPMSGILYKKNSYEF